MQTATRRVKTPPAPPTGSCRWLSKPAGSQLQGYLQVTTTHTRAGIATTVYEVSRLYHPATGNPLGWEVRPAVSGGLFPVPGEGYHVLDNGGCDCPAAKWSAGSCKHARFVRNAVAALAR